MSSLAITDKMLAVAKGLHVDYYDYKNHKYFEVHNEVQLPDDHICDIIISSDNAQIAFITSHSKRLVMCNLPAMKMCNSVILPRSASKIRFAKNNDQILVADKSGDVLIYNVANESSGTKLLGHLSLLLDVLQTNDKKYIITCDRDEKIKVSCYPNTYNIQTYCLGHKEFVNHIELLPHDDKFITSSSGDGTIKIWNYKNGKHCYSIKVSLDVGDDELSKSFAKTMDDEGVDVLTLPIVHYATTKLSDNTSLIAVTLHSYNSVIIYTLSTFNNEFHHRKEDSLILEKFPTALAFNNSSLFLYYSSDNSVSVMSIINSNDKVSLQLEKNIIMFEDVSIDYVMKPCLDTIKMLYKRKFDNVQEYQERKKQRIEKSVK